MVAEFIEVESLFVCFSARGISGWFLGTHGGVIPGSVVGRDDLKSGCHVDYMCLARCPLHITEYIGVTLTYHTEYRVRSSTLQVDASRERTSHADVRKV